MAKLNRWMRTNRLVAGLLVGMVAVLVLGAAFLGIAKATDTPGFCGAACHEMRPYHTAWSNGPHKDIACVECHVDTGTMPRLTHKFETLKEIAAHFSGNTAFPRSTPPSVPDARCVRCHSDPKPDIAGFDHAAHSKGKPCAQCHSHAGHTVTSAALLQAGVLNTDTASRSVSTETTKAVVDGGAADLVDHVTVSCSQCHVMSKTPCSSCHNSSKHSPRGECVTCHQPAATFAFTHPLSGVDCASCHQHPAKHTTDTECTKCHPSVAKEWKLPHTAGMNCADCHTRPAAHRAGTCSDCHTKPGASWAFTHPATSDCASCHDRPARHRDGSCATCHHNVGMSWAFSHPGIGASCSSCHPRPSGHRSGNCASCHHRAGVSWAFSHAGIRASCSSCHPRPSGHKSGQCSTCHRKPGVSWAFSHPRIPGGEHTSKSFACVKCHPSGTAAVYCSCHGGHPPTD